MAKPHTLYLMVAVRGSGEAGASGFMPQEVMAYSLTQALRMAEQIPFENWFEPEEAEYPLAEDPLYQMAMEQGSVSGVEQRRRNVKASDPDLYRYIRNVEGAAWLDGAGDNISGAMNRAGAAHRVWSMAERAGRAAEALRDGGE
jgi:hypothetical protein